MNKQLLFAVFLVFTIIFSVSAISASEVNVTDSYTTSLVDDTSDVSVPLEKTAGSSESSVYSYASVDNDSSKVSLSSEEVLESDISNTLSTNTMSNSLGDSANGVTSLAVSSSDIEVYEATSDVSLSVQLSDTIKASNITKYYKGSTPYTATFTDNKGNILKNTNVKITVNGVSYTTKTNSKGVASVDVNLKPGTYKVVAINPVTNYQLTTTFKVLSTIKANDVTKVYTDGKKFTATFLNSKGKALANKNVKFRINGKTYTAKTNSNGVASLSMTNLNVGTYKIISYNTDGLTKSNTVKVVRSTTSKLTTTDYTFYKSETKTIKVTLLNGLGYAPGAGKTVKFTVNGKTYTAKSNSNGVASITLPSLNPGVYTVKYAFDGNAFYTKSSASGKVCIVNDKNSKFTEKSSTTFIKGSGDQFKVALTVGDVPLEKRNVTFTVNGKSYVKTTDSSGIASLPVDLAVGKYTISYKFAGDSKINAVSGSSQITVKDKTATSLTWKSSTSLTQGSQTFKVLLTDSNKKALSGKTVKLTFNSKTYSATTDSSGYATFNVNADAGNYTVSYSFDGTNDKEYSSSTGSAKISVAKSVTSLNGYGYWVFGADMKNVDLKSLAAKGTTDIFLNFYAIKLHGQSAVESWIASANSYGMRVHIWMQAFYDGSWINPVKNGAANTAYFNQVISEAKKYAAIKGVAGIHFDYMRYPGTAHKTSGGTDAISQFAKLASESLHALNSKLIVSCSMMPETTSNIKYYGQDLAAISTYMDVVIPMVYKGNYQKTSSWVSTVTKWFVDNSNGAAIWVGLQGYNSDSDTTKLTTTDITKDAQTALNTKSSGVVIFRWGITNFVDFNSLTGKNPGSSTSTTDDTKTVTLANILTAANNLKSTISSTGAVPASVSVGGVTYSTPQFLYLMAKAIENINSGKTSAISVVSASAPSNSAGDSEGQLAKADYVNLASRVASFISNNKLAPNYATSTLGNIKYENLVDAFSRVLAYYKSNNALPSTVKISKITKSQSASTNTPTTKTITIKDILTGSSNLKTYYETNNKLPNTVTAGGITFTTPEFLYLMSQAIYQIGTSNSSAIAYITGVSAPQSPSGDAINSKQLTKGNYTVVANNVAKFIRTNKLAPNYASSTLGKIIYSELVDSFSRVLAYYNTNGALPNYVLINTGSSSSTVISGTGSGLNQKNTETDLSAYLKSSTNCQVNNSAIKSVVNSVTAGLTNTLDKAKAIYNYVRDSISYSFYYNTKYGATGTLSAKAGNCVDQAHLLVAMYRSAGIPARYVHGTCKFSSGSTYGHVWAQVLVNGQWYVVDPTSTRNSFGNVVNWNTNSFSLNGIYSSISF